MPRLSWTKGHIASRYALSITGQLVVTGKTVVRDFRANITEYGPPASTLTDNGLVFTTRVRGGKNAFENELRLLGVTQKSGRPNHPQTQRKVERFQQTMKRWLAAQPDCGTLDELQHQLDTFRDYYNNIRPHCSLDRATPAQAYNHRPKAGPSGTIAGHWRIRDDRIDDTGVVTIRYNSRLHHIGIGRAHKHVPVRILIHDQHIRIMNPTTGQLLRDLILDPDRDHQQSKTPSPKGEGVLRMYHDICARCLKTSHWRYRWDLNPSATP